MDKFLVWSFAGIFGKKLLRKVPGETLEKASRKFLEQILGGKSRKKFLANLVDNLHEKRHEGSTSTEEVVLRRSS